MNRRDVENEIIALVGNRALPPMSPDTIDDFVTYLYKYVDLYSFERSDIGVKLRYYKSFLRSLPQSKLKKALTQIRKVHQLQK